MGFDNDKSVHFLPSRLAGGSGCGIEDMYIQPLTWRSLDRKLLCETMIKRDRGVVEFLDDIAHNRFMFLQSLVQYDLVLIKKHYRTFSIKHFLVCWYECLWM